MIKEAKDIDFYTSGNEPSELDFARISEWISIKKSTKKGRQQSTLQPKNAPYLNSTSKK